jgi:hypothetical protein
MNPDENLPPHTPAKEKGETRDEFRMSSSKISDPATNVP